MPMTTILLLPRRPFFRARLALAAVLVPLLASCSPEKVLGGKPLPPDVPDPAQTHTPTGALAAYRGALAQLRTAFGGDSHSFIPVTGLLTDELRAGDLSGIPFDSRILPEDLGIASDPGIAINVYGLLQRVRGQASEARGALRAYVPDSSPALVGHLDAIQGYAEVFLADLFCSGIPLSTLDFGGDFTYAPGSSTEEVYEHAIALFDSARALSSDSASIMNLARVGKARALLALGRYAEASAAAASVPDGFRYAIAYSATTSSGTTNSDMNRSFAYRDFGAGGMLVTLVDTEGVNGLPFLSSADPRVAWVANGKSSYGASLFRAAMYPLDGSGSIVLASSVEARLIQAEGALDAGDASWLATLNALRTDGTYDTRPHPGDSTRTDTLWHAGTGGVAGLAPLADPAAADGRVDLVFHERAFWLFLTGHRQGDLRRLVRQYERQQQNVYPVGPYAGPYLQRYADYGSDVTAPIPGAEWVNNPRFTGCRSRGA